MPAFVTGVEEVVTPFVGRRKKRVGSFYRGRTPNSSEDVKSVEQCCQLAKVQSLSARVPTLLWRHVELPASGVRNHPPTVGALYVWEATIMVKELNDG